ncbi:hypothetical protein V6Z11_D03G024900 [Gossypium hirsutum]
MIAFFLQNTAKVSETQTVIDTVLPLYFNGVLRLLMRC